MLLAPRPVRGEAMTAMETTNHAQSPAVASASSEVERRRRSALRRVVVGVLAGLVALAPGRAPVYGQAEESGTARLLRVPDLSPELTGAEVEEGFATWRRFVSTRDPALGPALVARIEAAAAALGSRLPPAVTKLTVFSLFPERAGAGELELDDDTRHLLDLPRFHDYPILGSVTIDGEGAAGRWVQFLRDQIVPGGMFLCDFMPRHGFRLATADVDVDILMCFRCSQLKVFGGGKIDTADNPIFSQAVEAQLNRLFDKRGIERDLPAVSSPSGEGGRSQE